MMMMTSSRPSRTRPTRPATRPTRTTRTQVPRKTYVIRVYGYLDDNRRLLLGKQGSSFAYILAQAWRFGDQVEAQKQADRFARRNPTVRVAVEPI